MGPWSLSRDVVWAYALGAGVAGGGLLLRIPPPWVAGAVLAVGGLWIAAHQSRVARPLARLYAVLRAGRHGRIDLPEAPADGVARRQYELIRATVEVEADDAESTWIEPDPADAADNAIYRSGGQTLALSLRAASESGQIRAGLTGLAAALRQASASDEGSEALDALRETAEAEGERLRRSSARQSEAVAELRGALRQVARRLAELSATGRRLSMVEQGSERVDQQLAHLEASELPSQAQVTLAEARAQVHLQRQTLSGVQDELRECAERLQTSRNGFSELQPDLGPLVSAFLASVAALESQAERWRTGLRAAARSAKTVQGSVQALFELQPELQRQMRELELAWAEMQGTEAFSNQLLESLRYADGDEGTQSVVRAARHAQMRLDGLMERLEATAGRIRES